MKRKAEGEPLVESALQSSRASDTVGVLLAGLRVKNRYLRKLPRRLFWERVWAWVPPAPAAPRALYESEIISNYGETELILYEGSAHWSSKWDNEAGATRLVKMYSHQGFYQPYIKVCCFCMAVFFRPHNVRVVHDTSKGDDWTAKFWVCLKCASNPLNREYGLVPLKR